MRVEGIDHFNIRTHDLERLVAFYTQVLGLERGDRPPFASSGAWLYANGHPVLHVSVAEAASSGDTMPLDHVAFAVTGLEATRQRLREAGLDFQEFDVPGRAMRQIFIHDPDGVALELNFADPSDVGTEPAPVRRDRDSSARRRR